MRLRGLTWVLFLSVMARPAPIRGQDARSIEGLISAALESNQTLAGIRSKVAALREQVPQVGTWPDPLLSFEYSNMPIDTWSPGDHPMSGIQFKLQQRFPFPGKTRRRQDVARSRVKEGSIELEEARNQLRGAVRRLYWSIVLVHQLRVITQEHAKLLEQFIRVVRAKYEVGKVGMHDLLQLEVLRDRLRDDLKDFDQQERSLKATLGAVLHVDKDVGVAIPSSIPTTPPRLKEVDLMALALEHRPLLQQFRAAARTQQLAADQAAYEGWPDLTVWLGYRLRLQTPPADDGTDQITVGLSVPLPFSYQGRWGAKRAEHLKKAHELDARRASALDELKGRLRAALTAWSRATQKADTYEKQLIPQAKRTLDATFAAYQVDRAGFASLYQVELQLLELERAVVKSRIQALLQKSIVETLVGRALNRKD